MKLGFAGLCFLLLSLALSAQNKLSMEIVEIPPHTGSMLTGNGMLAQILAESLKGKGWTVEYHYFPLARVMKMMGDGTIHGTFTSEVTIDKDKFYYKLLQINRIVFFYKKSTFPSGLVFEKLSDLAKYRVGIVHGTPMEGILKNAGITVDGAVNEALNFKKLQADRVDLISTVDIFGLYQIKELELNSNEYGMTEPYETSNSIIAISKSVPDGDKAIKAIEDGFVTAKENGSLYKIIESFIGTGNVVDYLIP